MWSSHPQTPSLVSHAFGEGAWPPPRITEDPPLVIVIMYFRIKVRKKLIGDILHIVILDFSDNMLTLSVKIWCPGLVKSQWSAWLCMAIVTELGGIVRCSESDCRGGCKKIAQKSGEPHQYGGGGGALQLRLTRRCAKYNLVVLYNVLLQLPRVSDNSTPGRPISVPVFIYTFQ